MDPGEMDPGEMGHIQKTLNERLGYNEK